MKRYERTVSISPAGVLATTCKHKGTRRNTGSPSGDRGKGQLAARERQAGPYEVAERLAVPVKPGNSGGGKGPQLKGNARSGEGPRDWR
jgi:hypothetical protein